MHACLQIDEILRQIAVHTYAHGGPVEKRMVLSLAKTCHTFLEPMLDVLWCVQQDLLPLFKCLPRDLVQINAPKVPPWRSSNNFKYIWFKRPLQSSDWIRFQYHAKRIQSLSGGQQIRQILRTDALSALQEAHYSTLLPNLRQFHWNDTEGDSSFLPYVHLFLGKNVTHFTFTFMLGSRSSNAIAPFFHRLKAMNIPIQSFALHGDVSVEARTAFSGLVMALSCLRHLNAPTMILTDSDLLQLSSLPNLSRVVAQVHSLPNIASFGDIPFPRLGELYVTMSDPRYLERLLVGISSPCLKALIMHAPTLPHPEALERVLSTIGNHPSSSSLENVTLRSAPSSSEDEYTLTDVMIRSLFSLKNLVVIHLEIPCTYGFNDSLLNDMALAWPLIEDVLLISLTGWYNCHVTLDGLVPFVVNCPKLKSLHITVNASTTPMRELDGGSPNLLITQLTFGSSIIAPPLEPVAVFLSILFPNLKMIQTGWNMGNTEMEIFYEKSWEEVEGRLPANIDSCSIDGQFEGRSSLSSFW